MTSRTQVLLEMWMEARTRFSKQMALLSSADLQKKLAPSPNSVGFLIRHVGEWTDLDELKSYVSDSFEKLSAIVETQTDEDWETSITIKEFGTKTKAEAFGRIVSHTAYHSGQMAIIAKYGTASSSVF